MLKRWISAFIAVVLVLLLMPVFSIQGKAATNFAVSAQLIKVLKDMEGFSKFPYWDYAQWTVGYGTRCPDDKLETYKANGIPETEAEALLQQEISRFQTAVNNFASKYNLKLKQHQFDALVSFSYNCGERWMSETTGYFNQAVRSGNTGSAFLYGICLFSTAGGEYLLVNRRLAEANMYINGVYQASNSANFKVPDNFKYVFLDAGGATVPYKIFAYDANESTALPTNFKTVPVGADGKGGLFAYAFQGWFTADGKKLSAMDKNLVNGSVIYARWADPNGKVVEIPQGEQVNLQVTVDEGGWNIRSGPATYYNSVGKTVAGQVLRISQVCQGGGYTWGKYDKGWTALSDTNYEQVLKGVLNQAPFPKKAVVTGTGVNVRTGPSTGYSVVGTKTLGDQIVITREQKGGSYIWGQMTNGNWICMDYVRYELGKVLTATGIQVVKQPTRTTFYQNEALDTAAGVVALCYDDGSATGVPLTNSMVSGYNAGKLGKQTLTVTYNGFTTYYTVNVIQKECTITFKNWDGTVLQQKNYTHGATVTPPANPTRPIENKYIYQFIGWDKTVVNATEDAVYTAVYRQILRTYTVTFQNWDGTVLQSASYEYGQEVKPPENPTKPTEKYHYRFVGWDSPLTNCFGDKVYTAVFEEVVKNGDCNGDGDINNEDVIYLLWYTLFEDDYPLACNGDVNADGDVNNEDVIYLLWHTLFEEDYPI